MRPSPQLPFRQAATRAVLIALTRPARSLWQRERQRWAPWWSRLPLPGSLPPAEPRQLLRRALEGAQQLGETRDGKRILLVPGPLPAALLRELGRLRELSFRAVGEGSGKRRDIDAYDAWYRHILLWDEAQAEIVGAYRIADAGEVIATRGFAGLYTQSLFELDPARPHWRAGLELGRSFVQPAYWGSRSLDYLWQGIGAYLRQRPDIRWLFGPVSLSARLPRAAIETIAACYAARYPDRAGLARPRRPLLSQARLEALGAGWRELDEATAQTRLKVALAELGTSLPVLYRQYVDLCEPSGVSFASFSVDPAFSGCVDGFCCLDLTQLRPAKRARYIGPQATAG